MRWTLKLLLAGALFVSPALAEDGPDLEPTGPNFQNKRELPNPIPEGFNECVMVVWGEEAQKQFDERVGFFDPPITEHQTKVIRSGQKKEWGKFFYCEEHPT